MKKLLWILILVYGMGWIEAEEVERLKSEIIKKLVEILNPTHRREKIYVDKKCFPVDFSVERVGEAVDDPSRADVILVCDLDHFSFDMQSLKTKKMVIALSYREYMRHKDVAAGAFFWQKGRPNIIINARYIQSRGIHLPSRYSAFVE